MATTNEIIKIKIQSSGVSELTKLAKEFEKAGDSAEKAANKLKNSAHGIQSALSSINLSGQGVNASMQNLSTQISGLASAISQISGKTRTLKSLNNALTQSNQQVNQSHGDLQKSYGNLSVAEIGQARNMLGLSSVFGQVTGAARLFGSGVASGFNVAVAGGAGFTRIMTGIATPLVAGTKLAGEGLATLARHMESAVGTAAKFAAGLGVAGVALGALGIGKAVKNFEDFQISMQTIRAVADEDLDTVNEWMGKLEDKALQLGADYPLTSSQVAAGMKEMALAGFKMNEIFDASEGVVALSTAGLIDMGRASEIASAALRGFHLEAKDMGHVADVIAVVANKSAVSVEDLGQTFKYVAPIAGELGYHIEDVGMMAGIMGNRMIKGSQGGTTLRATLTRLASPTAEGAKWLQRLGIAMTETDGTMRPFKDVLGDLREGFKGLSETEKITAANTIVGRYAMSGFLATVGSSDAEFKDFVDSMTNVDGAAKRMAETMNQTLHGAIEQVTGSLEVLGISFVRGLDKPLQGALLYIRDLINLGLPLANTFGKKVGGGITAATNSLKNFVNGVRGYYQGVNASDKISEKYYQTTHKLAQEIYKASGIFDTNGDKITKASVPLSELTNLIVTKGLPAFDKFRATVVALWTVLNPLSIALDVLRGYLSGGVNGALDAFQTRIKAIANVFKSLAPKIVAELTKISVAILDWIADNAVDILNGMRDWTFSFVEWIAPAAKLIGERLALVVETILNWIGNNYSLILTKMATWADAFVNWAGPVLGRILTKLYTVASGIINFIADNAGVILDKLESWAIAFVQWVGPLAGRVLQSLGRLIISVLQWIQSNSDTIAANFLLWVDAAARWVLPLTARILVELARTLSKIISWVISHSGEIADAFASWIRAIAKELGKEEQWQGFINGARNVVNYVLGTLLPTVARIGSVIANNIPQIAMAVAAFYGLRLAVGVFAEIILGAARLVEAIGTIKTAFTAVFGVFTSAGGALAALSNPITWIIGAVGLLAAGFVTNFGGMRDVIITVVGAVIDFGKAFAWIGAVVGPIAEAAFGSIEKGVRILGGAVILVVEALYRLFGTLDHMLKLDFGGAAEALAGKFVPLNARFKDYASGANNAADSSKKASDSASDYNDTLAVLQGGMNSSVLSIDKLGLSSQKANDPLKNLGTNTNILGNNANNAASPVSILAGEINRLKDNSSKASSVISESQTSLNLLDDKISRMPKGVQDLWKSFKELNDKVKEGGPAQAENAQAMAEVEAKLKGMGGELPNVVDAYKFYNKNLEDNRKEQEDNAVSIYLNNKAQEEAKQKIQDSAKEHRELVKNLNLSHIAYLESAQTAEIMSGKVQLAFKGMSYEARTALNSLHFTGDGPIGGFSQFSDKAREALGKLPLVIQEELLKAGPITQASLSRLSDDAQKAFKNMSPAVRQEFSYLSRDVIQALNTLTPSAKEEISKLDRAIQSELLKAGPITKEALSKMSPEAQAAYNALSETTRERLGQLSGVAQAKLLMLNDTARSALSQLPLTAQQALLTLPDITMQNIGHLPQDVLNVFSQLPPSVQSQLVNIAPLTSAAWQGVSQATTAELSKLPPSVQMALAQAGPITQEALGKLPPIAQQAFAGLSQSAQIELSNLTERQRTVLMEMNNEAIQEFSKLPVGVQSTLINMRAIPWDTWPLPALESFSHLSLNAKLQLQNLDTATREALAQLTPTALEELGKLNMAVFGDLSKIPELTSVELAKLPPAARAELQKLPLEAQQALAGMPDHARTVFMQMLQRVQEGSNSLVVSTGQGATDAADAYTQNFTGLGNKTYEEMTDAEKAVVDKMGNISQVTSNEAKKIPAAVEKELVNLPEKFQKPFDDSNTKVTSGMQTISQTIQTEASKLPTTLQGELDKLPGIVEAAMGNLRAALMSIDMSTASMHIGSSIVDGIVAGINSNAGRAVAAAQNMAAQTAGASATNLEIHSPSRVFYKQGANVAEGLEKGILDNSGAPISAAGDMAQQVADKAAGGASGEEARKAGSSLVDEFTSGIAGNGGAPIAAFGGVLASLSKESIEEVGKQSEAFGKIADTVSKISDALTKIRGWAKVGVDAVKNFVSDTVVMTQEFVAGAANFSAEALTAAGTYADASGKVASAVGSMADSLNKVRGWSLINRQNILDFSKNQMEMVTAYVAGANFFNAEMLQAAGIYSDTTSKVGAATSSMADGLAKVRGWSKIALGYIEMFHANVFEMTNAFVAGGMYFSPEMQAGASNYADAAKKVAEAVGAMADSLNKIRNWSRIEIGYIQMFNADVFNIVDAFWAASKSFTIEMLTSANNYSDTAKKVSDVIGSMLPALDKLRDYKQVAKEIIEAFAGDMLFVVQLFVNAGSNFTSEMLAAASNFADTGGKVTSTIGSGVDGFDKLRNYQSVTRQHLLDFIADLLLAVQEFVAAAGNFKEEMYTAAKNFADAGGSVVGTIGNGVEGFNKLRSYSKTPASAIQSFVSDLITLLQTTISNLTADLQGPIMTQVKAFGEAINSLFGGFKSALDVFNGLKDYEQIPVERINGLIYNIQVAVQQAASLKETADKELMAQVKAFGEATNSLFGGLKTAMDVFTGLKEYEDVPVNVISGFVQKVVDTTNLAGQMASQANTELMGQAISFLGSAKEIFDLIKSAADALAGLKDIKDLPVKGVQSTLEGIMQAVTVLAAAVDQSAIFRDNAIRFRDNLKDALQAIKDGADAASQAAGIAANTPGNPGGNSGGKFTGGYIVGRASGGFAGNGVLVGENGPEIFYPGQQGGYIVNNPTARMNGLLDPQESASVGGITLVSNIEHVEINISKEESVNEDAIVQKVLKTMRAEQSRNNAELKKQFAAQLAMTGKGRVR